MKNYIGISRCIVDHWIYQDAEYFKTWFEMLYRARWKDEDKQELIEGQLVIIKRGYFIFGRQGWSKRIGISEQRLRTLIKRLIKENMIEAIEQHNKFTVYNIINYEKYNLQGNLQEEQENQQSEGNANLQNNQQSTFNQPTANLQLTTKEEREDRSKKEKNVIIILSPFENEFIEVLKTIENYPLDLQKEREMISTLQERYPALDLIQAIKDWAMYKKDNPLKAKCSPRSQINTSFKKYIEWGKCLKGGKNGYTINNKSNKSKFADLKIPKPKFDATIEYDDLI